MRDATNCRRPSDLENLLRITLNLADDVHAYVKQMSKQTGKTMGQVLSDLLRKELGLPPKESTTNQHKAANGEMSVKEDANAYDDRT